MAATWKKATLLTGIPVSSNPRHTLIRVYKNLTKLLQKMPENSTYRKSVESLVSQRLAIMDSIHDPKVLEEKIGAGQLEEVIIQARKEVELAELFLITKPWEPLITPIPKDQWKWPIN